MFKFNFFSDREFQIFNIASGVLFAGAFMLAAIAFEARYWNNLQVLFPGFVKAAPLMWFAQITYLISAAALGVTTVLILSWIGRLILSIVEDFFFILAIILHKIAKRKREKKATA